MRQDNKNELRSTRISLALKLVVTVWSFLVAVQSDSSRVSMLYLAVCILFAGLFVFQLSYYRKQSKKRQD